MLCWGRGEGEEKEGGGEQRRERGKKGEGERGRGEIQKGERVWLICYLLDYRYHEQLIQ